MIPETTNVILKRRINEYYKLVENKQMSVFNLINFDDVQKEQFKDLFRYGRVRLTFKCKE